MLNIVLRKNELLFFVLGIDYNYSLAGGIDQSAIFVSSEIVSKTKGSSADDIVKLKMMGQLI